MNVMNLMNELETKIELLLNYFGWQIFVNTVSRPSRPSRPSRCWQSWTPGWWQGLVLACGRAESRRQSVAACRVMPKSKSVPGVPCKHMQSLFILCRLWVHMEDMEDMESACIALCFGTWFGLWPRHQAFISTSWNHLPLGQSRLA